MRAASMLFGLALGCAGADPDAGRRAWLQQELLADNAGWLGSAPAQVAIKFEKMAADRYFFMRGTARIFHLDAADRGERRSQTAFGTTAQANMVWLVGDPHPENLSFFKPGADPSGDDLVLEWADLDASSFGPYVLDLRRLCLGMATLVSGLPRCDDCVDDVVAATAEAYVEEIERLGQGGADRAPSARTLDTGAHDGGEIVAELLRDAREEGPRAERIERVTELLDSGRRVFVLDPPTGPLDSGMVALDPTESAELDRLMDQYRDSGAAPRGMRVHDRARRLGMGVGSLPARRYVVLLDAGPNTSQTMITLRETRDPPPIGGSAPLAQGRWAHNGERVRAAADQLWRAPDSDPRHVALQDGMVAFKTLTWSSWHQDVEHDRVGRDWDRRDIHVGDLQALGAIAAVVLAGSHGRAERSDGGDGLAAIYADLEQGSPADFVDERVQQARADLRRLDQDHAHLRALIDEWGPLLGHEAVADAAEDPR